MTDILKVSGKRVTLPAPKGASAWKLSRRPGGWLVAERALPGGGREQRRLLIAETRGRLSANLGGLLFCGELVAASRGASAAAGGDADLVAQFPGKVRKLLVAAGGRVAEGDPLVLVEAMKMEFAVKAPFAGTVKKVLVTEGQQLSPGDRFVELLPEGGGDGAK